MAKRKITSDNFVAGLAAAFGIGAGSAAREAVGRNLSADNGDAISEIVALATENLNAAQLRALADALREAADADNGRQAQDSAWGRRKPDAFERRFPGSRRIGHPL